MPGELKNILTFEFGANKSTFEAHGVLKDSIVKNSIVEISVLEKVGDTYKILINGRVFQAHMPIDVKEGDKILAKVISQNPVALDLSSLTNLKALDDVQATNLLAKLKINISESGLKALKSITISGKPLLKRKIEALIEFLENSEGGFDENKIDFLVALIYSSTEGENYLNKKFANNFRQSINILFAHSFEIIKRIIQKNTRKELIEKLENTFIMDISEEVIDVKYFSDRKRKTIDVLKYLLREINRRNLDSVEIKDIRDLKDNIEKFLYQKQYYEKLGVVPDFIILYKKGKYELLEYQIEVNRKFNEETYAIKLKMNPEKLGLLQINGALTEKNVILKFFAKNETNKIISIEKNELVETLEKKLGLNSTLSFIDETTPISFGDKMYEKVKNIDVKA